VLTADDTEIRDAENKGNVVVVFWVTIDLAELIVNLELDSLL